jgi:hypothetical protein
MVEGAQRSRPRRGSPWRIARWSAAALLLLVPLAAMRFTAEVNWSAADFILAGSLLFGACGAYELAAGRMDGAAYRAGAAVAIVAALSLIWINLAVGIIGSEDNPANLMYAGVLAVGVVGAVGARFRPQGMARALVATALAQAAVAIIALVAGLGSTGPSLLLGGVFAALWLISAWLFRKATRAPPPATAAS